MAPLGLPKVGMRYTNLGRCSTMSFSSASVCTPLPSMGALMSCAPYKRKHWMVARKVGPSTITLSPGLMSVLPSRSSACWLPVVTMRFSGATPCAPLLAMNALSCSRSGW
jgi:hypothetical protein